MRLLPRVAELEALNVRWKSNKGDVPVQITSGWSIFKVNFLVPASLSITSFKAVILMLAGAADA